MTKKGNIQCQDFNYSCYGLLASMLNERPHGECLSIPQCQRAPACAACSPHLERVDRAPELTEKGWTQISSQGHIGAAGHVQSWLLVAFRPGEYVCGDLWSRIQPGKAYN